MVRRSVPLLALCACVQTTPSAPPQSAVAQTRAGALYTASPEHGAIAVMNTDTDEVRLVPVGDRPARVAIAQDSLLVTLQGERALLALSLPDLEPIGRLELGAEPYGVVVSPLGTHAYVAVSIMNEVVEVALDSLTISRRFEVPQQPRWLAMHPFEEALYAGSMMGGRLTYIDLRSGIAREVVLPNQHGQRFDPARGVLAALTFSRRLTGDLAVSPDGESLFVPALLVDNATPISASSSTLTPSLPGYQNRMSPTILRLPLDTAGAPLPQRAHPLPMQALLTSGPSLGFASISGYPVSLSIAPEGDALIAAMEGVNRLAIFSLVPAPSRSRSGLTAAGEASAGTLSIPGARPGLNQPASNFSGSVAGAGSAGAWIGFTVRTDAGPRGAVFGDDDQIFVISARDRTIARLSAEQLRAALSADVSALRQIELYSTVRMGPSILSPQQEEGQRLFFTMNDGRASGAGANISCASCHFEGRNDGLTWNFEGRGPRQTPSLAGSIGQTAPFGWEGQQATVADEALATSHERMSGALTPAQARAIAAFVERSPEIDPPLKDDPAIERGRAIFERSEVGCADCHNGPRLTDNRPYTMFGVEGVRTRSLVGISASAPYLHDGSAPDLRSLLEQLRDGSMGSTANLSETELEELLAYLRSL